jgi:hypothetical protein
MKVSGRIILTVFFLFLYTVTQGQSDQKKVLIHYMGWFGTGENGRHWSCGQAHTPLIGYYSSLSWAAQTYHILLSWSSGIDGLIINVKDDYDAECMNGIVQTLKRILEIDNTNFDYDFTISYDDQGLSNVFEAETKFFYLRDYILPEPISFLRYNGVPAIFTFNYPDEYLTAEDYGTALDAVFLTNRPKLIWNQINEDALGYVDSFFPWVEPGGTWNGSNWGQAYLDYFYPEIDNYVTQLDFATGGVWAGFDDRSNHCWGGTRWIERQNGWVYNKTWEYVNTYSGDLPLLWTVIETWNDWNEGTEIEPSVEDGYKYLVSTITNINTFKGTHLSTDTVKFEEAKRIYLLADSIESGIIDSATYYPILEDAIASFIHDNPVAITPGIASVNSTKLEISPNPSGSLLHFQISSSNASEAWLTIVDMHGQVAGTVFSGFLQEGNHTIEWNASDLKRGMYICQLKTPQRTIVKRITIL